MAFLKSPRVFDIASHATDTDLGPGKYELPTSIVKKNESSVPFSSSSQRMKDSNDLNPGPGEYDPVNPRANHFGFSSMASRSLRTVWGNDKSPSPDRYNSIKQWSPSIPQRMPFSSKSPRGTFYNIPDSNIHPAYVNTSASLSHGVSISHSDRPSIFLQQENPSPTQYDITSHDDKAIGASLRPSIYQDTIPQSPSFLSTVPRDTFSLKGHSSIDTPGLPQSDWSKLFPPSIPKRENVSSSSPRKRIDERSSWSFDSSGTPGPGSYNLSIPEKYFYSPSTVSNPLSRSVSRDESPMLNWLPKSSDEPGPTDYSPFTSSFTIHGKIKNKTISDPSKPFMQRSPRFDTYGNQEELANVGPGKYDPYSGEKIGKEKTLKKMSPSFLSKGERNPYPNVKICSFYPGPGRYSVKKGETKMNARKIRKSFNESSREKKGTIYGQIMLDNPGPSDYDPYHISIYDNSTKKTKYPNI